MTLYELVRSTIQFKRSRANPPRIRIRGYTIVPYEEAGFLEKVFRFSGRKVKGKNLVMIYLVSDSQVLGSPAYNVFFLFEDVEISDTYHHIKFPVKMSNGLYMSRPRIRKNKVRVRCTCEDFRWRFAFYNYKRNALYGLKPPPYVKRTNRPPVNPKQLPGICKHLMNSWRLLASKRVISLT